MILRMRRDGDEQILYRVAIEATLDKLKDKLEKKLYTREFEFEFYDDKWNNLSC